MKCAKCLDETNCLCIFFLKSEHSTKWEAGPPPSRRAILTRAYVRSANETVRKRSSETAVAFLYLPGKNDCPVSPQAHSSHLYVRRSSLQMEHIPGKFFIFKRALISLDPKDGGFSVKPLTSIRLELNTEYSSSQRIGCRALF